MVGFPISDEEKWRAAQNAGNVSMVNQSSMTPEQRAVLRERAAYDPKSREAILAAQLRAGRENLYSQGPRGKQVGNIYAAPTWSENLAHAIRQGVGGLEMRDARRGLEDVQMQRREAEAARGQLDEYADSQAVEQRGIDNSVTQQRMGLEDRRVQTGEGRLEADKANELYDRGRDVIGDERYTSEQETARREAQLDRDANAEIERIKSERELAVENLKAKGKVPSGSGGKRTATENTARYRAGTFRQGLDGMNKILDAGYNPSGVEGLKDVITNKSDLTRFLTTPEGQQFQASAIKVKEAALRTATGAAAPETEHAEYMTTLIPQVGDRLETRKWKMGQLEGFQKLLDENAQIANGDVELEKELYKASVNKIRNNINEEAVKESAENPKTVSTQEEVDELPSGAYYIDEEDGQRYQKP